MEENLKGKEIFDFSEPKNKDAKVTITLTRDMPFYNICPVYGYHDCLKAKVSYVPNGKVLENGVFRRFFDRTFNQTLESIAVDCFNYLDEKLSPKSMVVEMWLEHGTADHWVHYRVEK